MTRIASPTDALGASPTVCDNAVVAVIIRDELGRLLVIERATFPAGVAVAAGHVDDHGTPQDAAIAEVSEELGLTIDPDSLWLLTGGWRPNRCGRIPGPRGIGHTWSVFEASATTGDLEPSQRETRGARWLYSGQVQELASRTALYAHGRITDEEFQADPGIEPVQVQWLVDAGVIDIGPEDLALIDELAHRGGTEAAR